jgi:hypothetical protein
VNFERTVVKAIKQFNGAKAVDDLGLNVEPREVYMHKLVESFKEPWFAKLEHVLYHHSFVAALVHVY